MAERKPQMGRARLEVVEEAPDRGGELPLVDLDEVVAQDGGQGRRGRFVARPRADRHIRPAGVWDLAPQVAHPMGEAPLPQRAGEAGLDGADEARRPVSDHEQGVGQPPALQVLEEGRTTRRVLLATRGQVEQDLPPVLRDPPPRWTPKTGQSWTPENRPVR